MILAKYLLTAAKMATPIEKLDAQNSVCFPSFVRASTSSLWSVIHPVDPLTTFTLCLKALR